MLTKQETSGDSPSETPVPSLNSAVGDGLKPSLLLE
jgi:hypothetical protein